MDKKTTRLRRVRRAAAVTGAAALALATGAQAPALALGRTAAAPAATVPGMPDPAAFADCPRQLPEGADRSRWRCEVTVGRGHVTLGGIDLPDIRPMTIVHAEGPLADGSPGQVFGTLRAEATPVSGVPGRLGRLAVLPEYGGYADFLGTGTDRGALAVTFRLLSPLLPHGCTVGTDSAPVALHLKRDGASEWLSQDPPLVRFHGYDDTLAVPAATRCGPLQRALDHHYALPSPAGSSRVDLTVHYTFRSYDSLPVS